MNARKNYPAADAWHPALYVGMDPKFRGVRGMAQHKQGDWWHFMYHVPVVGDGVAIRGMEVFRTEIALQRIEP